MRGSMRFTSLASGSSGNCLVVESGGTRVMMDCGLSIADTRERLGSRGLAPRDVTAVVVTHEHDDHIGVVARFAKRYAIPVYLSRCTATWQPLDFPALLRPFIAPPHPVADSDLTTVHVP